MFIELVDDKDNNITYVIGFKEIGSLPKKRKPNPEVEQFSKKHGTVLMSAIDTGTSKYITIQGLTIASGWTIIEN